MTEYCAVAFHSRLTWEQSDKLESIQRTCLKVILGEMYVGYQAALEMCGLQTLHQRRLQRCLDFAEKCIKHPRLKRLFPLNEKTSVHYLRDEEVFKVNFAKTETYKKSTIPFCQRLLNNYVKKKWIVIYIVVNDNLIFLDVSQWFWKNKNLNNNKIIIDISLLKKNYEFMIFSIDAQYDSAILIVFY